MILLDESLGGRGTVGAVVTIGGAVLTSTDPRSIRSGTRNDAAGVPWAIVSTVLFGGATYVMGWAAREAGVLPSLWFGKLTMSVVFLGAAALLALRRHDAGPAFERAAGSALMLAIGVGLTELVGTISYAWGAEVGLLSIVTVASATYPLIPVIGGVTMLQERPAPTQYVGVAMVIGGLLLLGLA
jgi:drug/metabolite transporter (DMT)-like permease